MLESWRHIPRRQRFYVTHQSNIVGGPQRRLSHTHQPSVAGGPQRGPSHTHQSSVTGGPRRGPRHIHQPSVTGGLQRGPRHTRHPSVGWRTMKHRRHTHADVTNFQPNDITNFQLNVITNFQLNDITRTSWHHLEGVNVNVWKSRLKDNDDTALSNRLRHCGRNSRSMFILMWCVAAPLTMQSKL